MALFIEIEIFAYKWFHRILFDAKQLGKYDVLEVYNDECLAYPGCNEASDCYDLYDAIKFRRWLFEKLYLVEIQKQVNEFRHSQTDFYCYVLRTCNRVDLFGNLTIFERVFATCAFVCCLCLYCSEKEYSEVMKYGHLCWAMYFDQFTNEFYKQGGWNRLKMVAASYKLPIDFVDIVIGEEEENIILTRIRKAIKKYRSFKTIGVADHDECISMSWVKFYTRYINGSSDNEFDKFSEEFHSNELKTFSEVEDFLKQLKYLCDPNGSEIVKSLRRMSATNVGTQLETSMANLSIRDKCVNLESKETVLASTLERNPSFTNLALKSPKKLEAEDENVFIREIDKVAPRSLGISSNRNDMEKASDVSEADHMKTEYYQLKNQKEVKSDAIEHSFKKMSISELNGGKELQESRIPTAQLASTGRNDEKENYNKIPYYSREEQGERKLKEANKNKILTEQISSENNIEKNINKIQNGPIKEQDKRKIMQDIKRSTSLSGWITPTRRNDEKGSNNELQNARKQQEKRKSAKKIMIENTEMKNSEILDDARNGQGECKIIERKNKSSTRTAQKSLSERRFKKENNNKNQDEIREEKDELKEKKEGKYNAVPNGQMSSVSKNAEEENKNYNRIRKEQDGDVKNFLRMLLVLGDKQGISYVRRTS